MNDINSNSIMSTIVFQRGTGIIQPSSQSLDGGEVESLHVQGEVLKVQNAVADLVDKDSNTPHNPFPEGKNETEVPDFIRASWSKVQEYGLSPRKQSKISYYQKSGEWFINIDGTRVSIQNASAKSNPTAGIIVGNGNTYFTQPAAQKYAEDKGYTLPTSALWTKMAHFFGGVTHLRYILQIPFAGILNVKNDVQTVGNFAGIWSSDDGEYIYFHMNDSLDQDDSVKSFSENTLIDIGMSVRCMDLSV